MKKVLLLIAFILFEITFCQLLDKNEKIFTKADTLRGSNTKYRNWWDVLKYDITVEPNFENKTILGEVQISFKINENYIGNNIMQIDLQEPLQFDDIHFSFSDRGTSKNDSILTISERKNSNQNYILFAFDKSKINFIKDKIYYINIKYSGKPREAVNAPWDGGWIFKKDFYGKPFVSVACQGLGASVWYPCKDYQGDEPEFGASLTMIISDYLQGISNGKKVYEKKLQNNKKEVKWEVKNPINNYNIVPYIGDYVEIKDTFIGEKGKLNLSYYVLNGNEEKAKQTFNQTKPMLTIFEKWFGPYPFYEDGFKVVEASHLGMEHQSAIAYGNGFTNGYLGQSLSNAKWGEKFDFILIHESGHEWFGNNITTQDIADMWVHEAFTSYSEALYVEELYGKDAGSEYVIGTRKNFQNDKPIIGKYFVNEEGSGDMYFKGANMIHTLRHWVNNDEKFKNILRKMNANYYHQTITGKQMEDFLSKETGIDLSAFFNQYLRTIEIPVLEYKLENNTLKFRYQNTVSDFEMPVKLSNNTWIYPTKKWKCIEYRSTFFTIDENFLIKISSLN